MIRKMIRPTTTFPLKTKSPKAAIDRNRKGGAAGFGLGLNYVYRVAEAHGGEVRVFSIEGQSSEFTIYLPILIQTIETL